MNPAGPPRYPAFRDAVVRQFQPIPLEDRPQPPTRNAARSFPFPLNPSSDIDYVDGGHVRLRSDSVYEVTHETRTDSRWPEIEVVLYQRSPAPEVPQPVWKRTASAGAVTTPGSTTLSVVPVNEDWLITCWGKRIIGWEEPWWSFVPLACEATSEDEVCFSFGAPDDATADGELLSAAPLRQRVLVHVRVLAGVGQARASRSAPEPELLGGEYDNILSILNSMALVLERDPKGFVSMNEESLRSHFLVHLNGRYKGRATGETFNHQGKTEILIRADNRNVFITECKFWRGDESLRRTIDQVLSYLSWRDTKTAVLVFSRNSRFSDVLTRIPVVVRQHPCYLQELRRDDETTTFRYLFRSREDPGRHLFLTVMAFNIPQPEKPVSSRRRR